MTKEDRERELSGIATRRIDLGDLVVKLGGFVGGGGKVSEAIEKATSILTEQQKKCKNCENNLHTSDDCQNDPNCHDITQQIEKLKSLKQANETNQNNPNDLLNNLCTGLEKFLGFNSASKGYDGSGIVYSDLDRLCDGVMGFLSGVLGAVKDDDAVETYDRHLNKRLNDVLNTLTQKIGSGRAGLAASVAAVREWLEGYEKKLNEKIKNIVGPSGSIVKLKEQICRNINLVEHLKNGAFDDSVAKWSTSVTAYLDANVSAVKIAINALDSDLKSKLKCDFNEIKLKITDNKKNAAANQQELHNLANNIGQHMKELENKIINEAHTLATKCITELIHEFNINIQGPIKRVEEKLEDVQEKLSQWIKNVNHILTGVISRANQLHGALNHQKKGKSERETVIGKGIDKIEDIGTLVKSVDDQLQSRVKELSDWNIEAAKVVTAADERSRKILDKVYKVTGAQATDIGKKAEALKLKAENLLTAFKLSNDGLTTLMKNIQTEVQGLKKHIVDDLISLKGNVEQNIKEHLESIIDAILGAAGGAGGSVSYSGQKTAVMKLKSSLVGGLQNLGNIIKTLQTDGNTDHAAFGLETALFYLKTHLSLSSDSSIKILSLEHKKAIEAAITEFQQKATDNLRELNDMKDNDADDGKFGKVMTKYNQNIQARTPLQQAITKIQTDALKNFYDMDAFKDSTECEEYNGQKEELKLGQVTKATKAIQAHFTEITNHLNQIASLTDSSKKRANGSDAQGIRQKLVDLTNGLGVNESWKHNAKNGLQTITSAIGNQQSILQVQPKRMEECIKQITVELTKVQNILKNHKDGIFDQLNDLLTKGLNGADDKAWKETVGLKKLLYAIDHMLTEDSDGNLNTIVQATYDFVNKTIPSKIRNLMSHITAFLTAQVDDKILHIKKNALHRHVDATTKQLNALKDYVEERKTRIEGIITADNMTGIKGLINALSSNVSAYIDPLRYPTLPTFSEKVAWYWDPILVYIENQNTDPNNSATKLVTKSVVNPPPTSLPTDPATQLTKIKSDFDNLLTHLKNNSDKTRIHNYDHKFTQLLSLLSTSLHLLTPSHFANPRHPELLDAVRQGLQGFVDEMGKVYVNGYDGHKEKVDMEKLVDNGGNTDGKLTDDGRNLSKVFLTILDLMHREFEKLRTKYSFWYTDAIHLGLVSKTQTSGEKIKNPLGIFFSYSGYKVASNEDKQDGELQNDKTHMNVKKITDLCYNEIKNVDSATKAIVDRYVDTTTDGVKLHKLFDFLYTMLHKYRYVCHLRHIPGAKPPTTVNQMLHWFTGLCFNQVYGPLKSRLGKLLDDEIKEYDIKENYIQATVPYGDNWTKATVNIWNFTKVFENVITRSPRILVTILGHGDADGRYACDFFTNPDDLLYPGSPDQCLDMLVDIALRLNHQIRFLYKMFQNGKRSSGWQECWYGKHVAGSAWNCNRYPCDEQDCDQKHNQIANQTGDQNSKCGIKSPLQSFLEDGLPGFLPHSFKKPGCKLECTVSNHRGIPCKTPMGFRDLSIIASHRRTGQDIRQVLDGFCGFTNESLSLLCSYFLCLLRRPPQTLCDMFAFYHNFLEHWTGDIPNDQTVKNHKKEAFEKAVKDANFGIEDTTLDVTSLQGGRQHGKHYSAQDKKHTGDLFSLICCEPGEPAKLPCGSYLQPLSLDIRCVFSETYASLYMSWIVYMTETFYNLLNELYEKCCNSCNKKGRRCYDRTCAEKCEVRYTSDTNFKALESKNHDKECNSIVQCRDTHATIFAAGFTFGSPYEMSGEKGQDRKRTCQDFCAALEKVCSEKSALAELVHVKIPNFLWQIREKFFWTTVALWSASFFYLIYVMVGRLDLLHIKSHLRSPASHRIAAQSLLAAARIGNLAKISYLQP